MFELVLEIYLRPKHQCKLLKNPGNFRGFLFYVEPRAGSCSSRMIFDHPPETGSGRKPNYWLPKIAYAIFPSIQLPIYKKVPLKQDFLSQMLSWSHQRELNP